MKKWLWFLMFLLTFGAGAFYLVDRSKDKESKRISDQSLRDSQGLQAPIAPPPPAAAPVQPPSLPEPRRGGSAPAYQDPNYPIPPPDQNFNAPPPAFDNIPPPAQVYPDSPPAPYIPPEPDEFGAPGDPGDPPMDPYEGVDPQYVPSEPLDGDILPPPGDGQEY